MTLRTHFRGAIQITFKYKYVSSLNEAILFKFGGNMQQIYIILDEFIGEKIKAPYVSFREIVFENLNFY